MGRKNKTKAKEGKIGSLIVHLHLPENNSLKGKRYILRSLKDRLRSRFNVSVSEIDQNEKWQRAMIGVVCIGADREYLNGLLCRVVDFIRQIYTVEIIDYTIEVW